MKIVSCFIIVLSLTGYSRAWAGKGAVGAAETNMMQNVASQGMTVAFTVENASNCKNSYMACIKAALGAAQLSQLISQFGKSKRTRDDFALDDFKGFDPNDMGYCLDPATCEQDELDRAITETPLGPALQKGDAEALEKAISEIDQQNKKMISDLEKKGFDVDASAGTVAGPDGKKHDLNSSLMNLSQGMKDALKSKFAAIDESIGNSTKSSDRGLASQKAGSSGSNSGGSSGLKIKEEYVDGDSSFSPFSKNLRKKKKIKDEILSAMADKNTVGVVGMAGDNIFQMIQRRYEKKKKSREFISGR